MKSRGIILIAVGFPLLAAQRALKDAQIEEEDVLIVTDAKEALRYSELPENTHYVSTNRHKFIYDLPVQNLAVELSRKEVKKNYKPYQNKMTKGRR